MDGQWNVAEQRLLVAGCFTEGDSYNLCNENNGVAICVTCLLAGQPPQSPTLFFTDR